MRDPLLHESGSDPAFAKLVIGADVGGTNTKMALGRVTRGRVELVASCVYASTEFDALERVIELFLERPDVGPHAHALSGACFAVAGPVGTDGRAKLTNLGWQPCETDLARRFGFPRVRIINDFAAAGLGIEQLDEHDLLTLQPGVHADRAQRVVVGAGTGLGVAVLDWDGEYYEVLPSEAGHTDFAPVDALQDRLLAHLRQQFARVSCERVLSGGGLKRVLDFLVASGAGRPGAALDSAMNEGDPARAISECALAGRDALAEQALDLFVAAYGSFAGNMALTTLARGGVYIAGGIAPKIARKLEDGTFLRAFNSKGRFRALLEAIPVRIVMNAQVGLLGALAEAAR